MKQGNVREVGIGLIDRAAVQPVDMVFDGGQVGCRDRNVVLDISLKVVGEELVADRLVKISVSAADGIAVAINTDTQNAALRVVNSIRMDPGEKALTSTIGNLIRTRTRIQSARAPNRHGDL